MIPTASGRATAGPDLGFKVREARAIAGATPTLGFLLDIANPSGIPVRSLLLHAQIRIQAPRRRYDADERERLGELFGRPEQWADSLRSLFWTSVTALVPGFDGDAAAEMAVPATYDFEVTAAKYLNALDDGDIPLEFLFSGTAFYESDGRLQVARISWDKEATFRLPVTTWREAIDSHFPNSAWLRVDRDVFDRLWRYRAAHNLPSWELVLTDLLDAAVAPAAAPARVQ